MAKRAKKNIDWENLDWNEDEEEIIWVSKSEIKRDAEALKQLGEQLVSLTKPQLAKMPLNSQLLEAIELAQRLQKEAKRRQLQYIGKLLRNNDVEPIQEALQKLENKHQQQQALLHHLEQLRDNLLQHSDTLTQLCQQQPEIEPQYLRQLIRQAQKEQSQNKSAKAYREIFQYLKQIYLTD